MGTQSSLAHNARPYFQTSGTKKRADITKLNSIETHVPKAYWKLPQKCCRHHFKNHWKFYFKHCAILLNFLRAGNGVTTLRLVENVCIWTSLRNAFILITLSNNVLSARIDNIEPYGVDFKITLAKFVVKILQRTY